MEEIKDFYSKEESDFPSEMSKKDSPLLDMESFETLDSSLNAAGGFGGDFAPEKPKTLEDFDDFPSKLASTTRPLVTSGDEDISPASNLLDYVNVGQDSSLIDIGADTRVEEDKLAESQQQRDQLLIDDQAGGPFSYTLSEETIAAAAENSGYSPVPSCKLEHESEPKIKEDPKIEEARGRFG